VDDWIQSLAQLPSVYSYVALFLIVFAENVGLPVPGETMVLAAGMLASRPEATLSVPGVILVTVCAAVLGDNLGFWLGREFARARVQRGGRFLFLTPASLKVVEGYFEHYGSMTVFFARFVTGLRVVAALAAGTSAMAWPRFILANAGGAIAWAVCMTLLGFFGGHSWQTLHRWLGRGGLIVVGSIVLIIGFPYLWRQMRRLPTGSWERLLRSQVVTGVLAAILVTFCLGGVVFLSVQRHTPPHEDVEVEAWVAHAQQHLPWMNTIAVSGSYLGTLPITAGLAIGMIAYLWRVGRPRQEIIVILATLIASELLGLLLLGLLRHQNIEPAKALAWPFGFAGIAPLRSAAVYGMMGHVLRRQLMRYRLIVGLAALVLIAIVGLSVVWAREQYLTEVLVEFVAGSLVLFVGFYWLEGYGLAPKPGPPGAPAPESL
jgi:membrane protein DedA with SNARE-associated domain